MTESQLPYGQGDASYRAAGGEAGLRRLVDDFYDIMSGSDAYKVIREMHPAELETSRDKLSRFLCGWLGGPRRYREKYGPIHIPRFHQHLPIGDAEKSQWLDCMAAALARQDYADSFRDYLLEQLAIPAERIVSLRAADTQSSENLDRA